MAHKRSIEEFPEERTRQQSSLAVQTGSKAQESIFHQWRLPNPTKNGLIIFLCFGYSQRPLIVFILNWPGLRPAKHSFKISNRQSQKDAKSCCFLPNILHKRKFSQVTHARLLKQNPRTQNAQGKNSGVQDDSERDSTLKGFRWKHQAVLWKGKNTQH